jgi:hypothetical protein
MRTTWPCSFNEFSWHDSGLDVWFRGSGLAPRGILWEPSTFEALLLCVAGNNESLGEFERVGEVALRRGRGSSGECDDVWLGF